MWTEYQYVSFRGFQSSNLRTKLLGWCSHLGLNGEDQYLPWMKLPKCMLLGEKRLETWDPITGSVLRPLNLTNLPCNHHLGQGKRWSQHCNTFYVNTNVYRNAVDPAMEGRLNVITLNLQCNLKLPFLITYPTVFPCSKQCGRRSSYLQGCKHHGFGID